MAIGDFRFGVGSDFLDGVAGNRNTTVGVLYIIPAKELGSYYRTTLSSLRLLLLFYHCLLPHVTFVIP